MITTQDCDTSVAATMVASAAEGHDSLAWSECDGEPYYQECDAELYEEPHGDDESPWWTWAVVSAAWTAGAAALGIVIAVGFVAIAQ
jgi:hypothetical protein